MGPGTRLWMLLTVCAAVLRPGAAPAQRPVCPPPVPDQVYYTACGVGGQVPVSRFLAEFATDHLFKSKTFPFTRRAIDVLRVFDPGSVITDDHPVLPYLQRLKPIVFTRLDTAAGFVDWRVDESDRSFATHVEVAHQQYDVSWQLPARVAGGYWRTPGVLQVALWESQRPTLAVQSQDGLHLSVEVSCMVLSADGLRVVTTEPSTPEVLVLLGPCH